MSLTSDIKESYRYNMDNKLKQLCDSYEQLKIENTELKRKLKIAEDALDLILKENSRQDAFLNINIVSGSGETALDALEIIRNGDVFHDSMGV